MNLKLKLVGVLFTVIALGIHLAEGVFSSACLQMDDDFLKRPGKDIWNSDLCDFLRFPMAMVITIFNVGCILCVIYFTVGVWKARHMLLLPWLALQPAAITSEFAYMVSTSDFTALSIVTVLHIILYIFGIYIHHFVLRFAKKHSFA